MKKLFMQREHFGENFQVFHDAKAATTLPSVPIYAACLNFKYIKNTSHGTILWDDKCSDFSE